MKTIIKTLLSFALLQPISGTWAMEYPLPEDGSNLIGQNSYYVVPDDKRTLESIAAEMQLGLTNLTQANPGVDPFLPQAGTTLVIPHKLILPDTPKQGVIINIAEMRLYYYPKGENVVKVYPIGIGEIGKGTPENWVTAVYRKKANPTWTPTAKMHKEYEARGETLPKVWPAGPDNPMGLFALYVGKLYAVHGTNASFGIGLRVSHGCVRLRNDDIENLFNTVPIGTRVQFTNQPIKMAVTADNKHYLEVHQPLSRTVEEFNSDEVPPLNITPKISDFIAQAESDSYTLKRVLNDRSGIPTQIDPE